MSCDRGLHLGQQLLARVFGGMELSNKLEQGHNSNDACAVARRVRWLAVTYNTTRTTQHVQHNMYNTTCTTQHVQHNMYVQQDDLPLGEYIFWAPLKKIKPREHPQTKMKPNIHQARTNGKRKSLRIIHVARRSCFVARQTSFAERHKVPTCGNRAGAHASTIPCDVVRRHKARLISLIAKSTNKTRVSLGVCEQASVRSTSVLLLLPYRPDATGEDYSRTHTRQRLVRVEAKNYWGGHNSTTQLSDSTQPKSTQLKSNPLEINSTDVPNSIHRFAPLRGEPGLEVGAVHEPTVQGLPLNVRERLEHQNTRTESVTHKPNQTRTKNGA